MAIADELELVVRHCRYFPELIPFIHTQNLAAGDNSIFHLTSPTLSYATPALTDKLSADRDTDVLIKLIADRRSAQAETGSLKNIGELTPFSFLATRGLSLTLNADAPVEPYNMYLGMWVLEPSVAQKILWGLPLSRGDEELSRKRGVRDSVNKGILPFPTSYQIERECMGFKETVAEIAATAPAGTTTSVTTMSPISTDEFLVLEGVAADSAGLVLANNVEIWVTRDDDRDLWKLPVLPMSLNYDFPCFLPCLKKLEIKVYTDLLLANFEVRAIIGRYKLTDILRARFGLESTPEALESTRAGVVP